MAAKKRTLTLKSDIRGAVAPKVKDAHTRNPLRGAPVPGRNEVMYGRELGIAIEAEMAELAAVGAKHQDTQSTKAKNPRAVIGRDREHGDPGRTMGDLVDVLARGNPDSTPLDLWPHLGSAIEAWAKDCEEVRGGKNPQYRYPFPGSKDGRTITLKQFRERLREARKP